jgi:hypothetical protein
MGKRKSSDEEVGQRPLQTLERRSTRTNLARSRGPSVKGSEWWFDQLVEYYEEDSRASVNSLTEWCRRNGRLAQDELAPARRTLELWAAKNQWQQRKTSFEVAPPGTGSNSNAVGQDHERVATYVTRNLRVLCTQSACGCEVGLRPQQARNSDATLKNRVG